MGGSELSGSLGIEAWPHSLRFYFRSTVKHVTHNHFKNEFCVANSSTLHHKNMLGDQGQVLELRFHFPSRACFLTR